jgi:hypothetical protein
VPETIADVLSHSLADALTGSRDNRVSPFFDTSGLFRSTSEMRLLAEPSCFPWVKTANDPFRNLVHNLLAGAIVPFELI